MEEGAKEKKIKTRSSQPTSTVGIQGLQTRIKSVTEIILEMRIDHSSQSVRTDSG